MHSFDLAVAQTCIEKDYRVIILRPILGATELQVMLAEADVSSFSLVLP